MPAPTLPLVVPPVRIRPPVPSSSVEIVTPAFLTVIFGAPVPPVLSRVRIFPTPCVVPVPLFAKVQLLETVVLSPKINWPTVRDESKLIVVSAVMLRVVITKSKNGRRGQGGFGGGGTSRAPPWSTAPRIELTPSNLTSCKSCSAKVAVQKLQLVIWWRIPRARCSSPFF